MGRDREGLWAVDVKEMMAETARTTEPAAPHNALSNVLGFKIRNLHNRLNLSWNARFARRGLGLTPVQGGILVMISENPGITQVALAQMMEVEAPTLSQMLAPLVKSDMVRRDRSAADARASALSLTKSGVEMCGLLKQEMQARERDVLKNLTKNERKQLHALLDKLSP